MCNTAIYLWTANISETRFFICALIIQGFLCKLCSKGLEKPSVVHVHQRGIVPFCNGQSVIHHESLSGTTVTLCAGVLQRLDYGSAQCQAPIVVPADARPDVRDRESDRSTRPVPRCQGLHPHLPEARLHECPRGPGNCVSSRSAQVAIGTPGRVLGLLGSRKGCVA